MLKILFNLRIWCITSTSQALLYMHVSIHSSVSIGNQSLFTDDPFDVMFDHKINNTIYEKNACFLVNKLIIISRVWALGMMTMATQQRREVQLHDNRTNIGTITVSNSFDISGLKINISNK